MEHEIKDGIRTIKVRGDLLASSTSEEKFKDRWVEFKLYRAENSGVYVVSRIGRSRLIHSEACKVVSRNHLTPVDPMELEGTFIPCDKCNPNLADPEGLFPEVARYHSQVCNSPVGVLRYLTKLDEDGSEYLTKVARNLLEEASRVDLDIKDAYMGEVID